MFIDNAYDGFGRMTQSSNTMGGAALTTTYAYDDNSNRTHITHDDGTSFTYRYDNLNRETVLRLVGGGYVKNAIYNNRGNIRLLGVGSGAINGYSFDNAGRLNRISTALAGTDADNQFNFTYNPVSQIKSRTISNDAYANTAHYDVQRNYTTNGLNQYTGAGPSSFAYDPNGNLTSDGAVNFTYDVENRLVEASGARNAEIIYDPLGRLWEVNQGSSATTTRFLYDGDALIAEYDGLGNMLRRYVHGGGVDQPLLWYEGDQTDSASQRGLFANHQGSIAAVADSTGNAIAINGYDSYGIPNETNIGRFQYTGQIWLPELGLYYYKARIYSPTLGRFLQTDPIGYEDQYNLYAYVGNDPVNLVDPTGLQGCDVKRAGCSSERGEEGNGSRPDFINPDSITDPDSYWEGQIRQGDPLGETASQFGKPRSEMNFGAALSDGKLQDNLEEKHKSSEATFTASGGITIRVPVLNAKARKNLAADRKKIRLEIARAHQTALNEKRGWLTSQEIREYHEDVFEDNGLPRSTFGGSGLGYIVPDIVWCRRCPSS